MRRKIAIHNTLWCGVMIIGSVVRQRVSQILKIPAWYAVDDTAGAT